MKIVHDCSEYSFRQNRAIFGFQPLFSIISQIFRTKTQNNTNNTIYRPNSHFTTLLQAPQRYRFVEVQPIYKCRLLLDHLCCDIE